MGATCQSDGSVILLPKGSSTITVRATVTQGATYTINGEEYDTSEAPVIDFVPNGNGEMELVLKATLGTDEQADIKTYTVKAVEDVDVYQTEKKIAAIGEVVVSSASKKAIEAARDAYDELTKEQQDTVSNYKVLQDAEAIWQGFVDKYTPVFNSFPKEIIYNLGDEAEPIELDLTIRRSR